MRTRLAKVFQSFVLGVLLFATPSIEPNTILAGTRKPRKLQAQKTIAAFLSSVELGEHVYNFDHNGDGVDDMYVYPLITTNPDLKTKYITLEKAAKKKQIILKENATNHSLNRKDPPSSYNIVAQLMGLGYGYGGSSYYPRGGMIGGGYQSRGFGRGGILGGSGYGTGGYLGSPGYKRYPGFGFRDAGSESGEFSKVVALGEFDFVADTKFQSPQNIGSPEPMDKPEFDVDALCFEKWRLIKESRRMGAPEYFSYIGMASPYVRKELVLFPNQVNIDKIIAKELRKLGVFSTTHALIDVFKNPAIKEVIDYYTVNSKKVTAENKGISGIIVTSRSKILCADIYSSPDLFKKMFSQLMQSAALGVCRRGERSRKHLREGDVAKFLSDLKKAEKLKKESWQTYRLFYPKIIAGAELLSDENGTKVVHLEAYPRK